MMAESEGMAKVLSHLSVSPEPPSVPVHSAGGAMKPSNDQISDQLMKMFKWQSLLLQFLHPQVRNDFLNGLLDVEASESLLSDIDVVRAILIPPWRGSSSTAMQSQVETSYNHAHFRLNESSDVFDVGDRLWTYQAWSKYLAQLARANYWKFTPPSLISIKNI